MRHESPLAKGSCTGATGITHVTKTTASGGVLAVATSGERDGDNEMLKKNSSDRITAEKQADYYRWFLNFCV